MPDSAEFVADQMYAEALGAIKPNSCKLITTI